MISGIVRQGFRLGLRTYSYSPRFSLMPGVTEVDLDIWAEYMKKELPEQEWREIDREADYWKKSLSNSNKDTNKSEKRISAIFKKANVKRDVG